MPFQTANGCTVSTHSAPMMVTELGEEISPFILDDTPAVLYVGDRCMNKVFLLAFGSRWIFIDNIPYLRRGSVRSAPKEIENRGSMLTPRRSRKAYPVADLGGIPDS
eukprot:14232780-Heterocapsa_arctica.AAC.1